jgi:DNA-binding beta-propeller fold protein YncE
MDARSNPRDARQTRWFTEQQGNKIGKIQLSAPASEQAASEVPTAKVLAEWKVNNPSGIFIGFDSVWVPGYHDSTTTRIDPATNKISAVIQGTGDHAEQALAVGDVLWVTGQRDDTTWLDPKTNTVTKTAPKIKGEHHYIANGFNSLWITTGDNKLDRVDPATSKIMASIPYADGYADCQGFVVATTTAIWVEQCDKAELIKVDPATNSVASKTPWTTLIDQAKAQATVPAGKGIDFIWIYIVGDEGEGGIPEGLLRIDPNTGTGLTFLPLIPDQSGDGFIAISDEAAWIGGLGQINRVNIATNKIDATYKTDPGAIIHLGIGFGSIWLENYEENLVQRLDITP